jgi:hypothetical protein
MVPAQAKEITMASALEQEKISMAWHAWKDAVPRISG